MFSSINKKFGCCSKMFGCSNKKIICCPWFCCRNKTIFDLRALTSAWRGVNWSCDLRIAIGHVFTAFFSCHCVNQTNKSLIPSFSRRRFPWFIFYTRTDTSRSSPPSSPVDRVTLCGFPLWWMGFVDFWLSDRTDTQISLVMWAVMCLCVFLPLAEIASRVLAG